MRRVTLIRHAKSSWDNSHLKDEERPLNKRGRNNAPMMGERLASRGMKPDLLVSSPAIRAFETAIAIAREINYPTESILTDDRLYHANINNWFAVIGSLPEAAAHTLCFGHNPGLTHLFNVLSPHPVENVPTCGVMDFEFNVENWAEIAHAKPERIRYDYPKSSGMQEVLG